MPKKQNYDNHDAWPYAKYSDFRKQLELAAALWFAEKGKVVSTSAPYMLRRRSDWADNIILLNVAEYVLKQKQEHEAIKESFPLHKFIHHGLSSQAMLFNLFGPLVVSGDLEAARAAFGNIGWPSGEVTAVFEVDDRTVFNEKQAQPTSIDLVISGTQDGVSLFVEAKLVEQEFGGCSVFSNGDCDGQNPAKDFSLCYLHFIERTYWPRLKDMDFLKGPMKEGLICPLAAYYQFFREVLFALVKGGYFVLLYDERSPVFYSLGPNGSRGLMPFLKAFVPDQFQLCIGSVSIQEAVRAIKESKRHNHWIYEFEKKYGLA